MDDCRSSSSSDEKMLDDDEQDMEIPEVYVDADGRTRYFDGQSYRCCFSAFHAKIGTFVLVTLVFHEIIIVIFGMLYLLSRNEMVYRNLGTHYITVFVSRLIQLVFSGVMYFALWRQQWKYIVPFAFSQLTFGAYADISTIIMLVDDLSKLWPLSSSSLQWLNFGFPISGYLIFLTWLMYALYHCAVYFHDHYKHEQRKQSLLNDDSNSDDDDDSFDFDDTS